MNKKIMIFFLLVNILSYSQIEEGFIAIRINEKVGITHHRVLIDENEIYISLERFSYLIGMENNKKEGMKYYVDIGNVFGQEKIVDFESQEIIDLSKTGRNRKKISGLLEKDGKIYVQKDSLGEIFSLKEKSFDEDRLELKVSLNFEAPYQEKIKREARRKELLEKKDKDIQKEVTSVPSLFEPGNLRTVFRYDKYFGGDSIESKSVAGEYIGPLLYGTFSAYYDIYPSLEKREMKLVYEEVTKNQTIVIGDISPVLPNVLSGTVGRMKGISYIEDYRTTTLVENGDITISGYSDNGKTVELYQNSKLLAFTDVEQGRYTFEKVPITFYSDTYDLVIYNRDGTRTTERLRNFYNNEGKKKGEIGYNIYMGEDEYSGYNQRMASVEYGLTDNYTINAGVFDLKYNDDEKKTEGRVLNLGLNYRTFLSANPMSYHVELFNDLDTGTTDLTFKLNLDRNKYYFNLDAGNYSGKTIERLNVKNEVYSEITRDSLDIFNLSISPGITYNRVVYEDNDERNRLGIVLRGNLKSWIPEYRLSKEFNNDRLEQEFSLRSYIFRDYYINMSAKNTDEKGENAMTYRGELSTRMGGDTSLESLIYYENTESGGDVFGIEFSVDYDNWFTADSRYDRSHGKGSSSAGFEIDRTISLSNVNGGTISRVENGWVHGVVFLDDDGDGIYNEETERVLKKTKMKLNGHSMETDSDGKYHFVDIYPQMPLWLSATPLNPLQVSKTKRFLVKPRSASGVKLNIPISTLKIVTGNLIFKVPELARTLISSIYIRVKDVETGEDVSVVIPESDGFFVIENITTGKYLVSIESVEDPDNKLYEKEITINGLKNDVNLDIEIGGEHATAQKELSFDFILTYSD